MTVNSSINDTLDRFDVDSNLAKAFHWSVLATLMFLIILGNGVLVFAVLTTARLRTVTNFFILSLASSDLMVGVVVIPVNFVFSTALLKGYSTCRYAAAFTVIVCISSIANIVAVTVDRYLAITSPLKYSVTMSKCRALIIICVVWVYAFIIGFLPLMGWRRTTNTCQRGEVYPPGYAVVLFLMGLVIPIVVSTALYCRILSEANRQANRIRHCEVEAKEIEGNVENDENHASKNDVSNGASVSDLNIEAGKAQNKSKRHTNRKSNRKAFRTVIYILAYFEISWFPLFLSLLIDAFYSPRLISLEVRSFISLLALGNSVMDPLIYGYFNRDLRNRIKEILSKVLLHCHR